MRSIPAQGFAPARHNLPVALTSFVGREHEIAAVRGQLGEGRLLTLTGSGGCGKTRLALRVAAQCVESDFESVWLVELGPLVDPMLVPEAVAEALQVREQPGRGFGETLVEALGDRHVLLVLDNCEHLLLACSRLAHQLLTSCAGVRILATSREPLGVAGETVWRVPSLAEAEAVRLFVERARAARPSFALTGATYAHVIDVCQRMDGIPLAIELAAARVGGLGVEQIAARLDDRFRLQLAGYRLAPPRHQTLRAALDWSHDLLAEDERVLLRRLAVFAGGFTLEAAEAVCGADVLQPLLQLVDKSLVEAEPGRATRFRLLETVRQYASEKLQAAQERDRLGARHVGWCHSLADTAEAEQRGAEQSAWLSRLETEHDNLRSALTWAAEQPEGAADTLRLAAGLWWFWRERGHASEGRQWLARGLRLTGAVSPTVRARALDALGALAHSQGAFGDARAAEEAALEIWRAQGDQRGMAAALNTLGIVAKAEGDYARAEKLLQEMLDLARQAGDTPRVATALNNLAALAMDQGEYARAQPLLSESLALKRTLGDTVGTVAALHNLGDAAFHLGAYREAAALFEQSVSVSRSVGAMHRTAQSRHGLGMSLLRLGDQAGAVGHLREGLARLRDMRDAWGTALCLEGLAQAMSVRGADQVTVQLFAAAAAWRQASGSPVPPNDRADYDRWLASVSRQLGEARFGAAWAHGCALTLEQAASEALAMEPPSAAGAEAGPLSPRERQVAALVARGMTNRQIADALSISKSTADRHVTNILTKLTFASRAQLAAWVVEQRS